MLNSLQHSGGDSQTGGCGGSWPPSPPWHEEQENMSYWVGPKMWKRKNYPSPWKNYTDFLGQNPSYPYKLKIKKKKKKGFDKFKINQYYLVLSYYCHTTGWGDVTIKINFFKNKKLKVDFH